MNFRGVLTTMDDCENRGIDYVDSDYLASVLDCTTKQASKHLGRLHRMGFLVREREKRLCISKNGKQCHKGYCYEYAFSSQGRKYIQWMRDGRPLREGTFLKMMSQVVPYLSEDEKDALLYASLLRSQMRYKGPSRELQDFGLLMVAAVPAVTRKLADLSKEKALLEFKRDQLEGVIKEQASQINRLQEKAINILIEQRRLKDEEAQKLAVMLSKPLMRSYEENEALLHIIDALRRLSNVYEGMTLDLGALLAARNPEATAKLLDFIARRYSTQFGMAKESMGRAEQTLRKLREESKTASSTAAQSMSTQRIP